MKFSDYIKETNYGKTDQEITDFINYVVDRVQKTKQRGTVNVQVKIELLENEQIIITPLVKAAAPSSEFEPTVLEDV